MEGTVEVIPTTIWIIVLLVGLGALAYPRSPRWLRLMAVVVGAVALAALTDPLRASLAGIPLLLALLVTHRPVRRRLISAPLLSRYRKVMPTLSRTEREALDAGTLWWDRELFSGRPDWGKLHALPAARLTREEQAFLDGPVETLCRMLDDWRINQELQDLPPEVWRLLKEQGFFGMIIPKRYGGLEFSAYAHSTVVMKIASRSLAAAVTVMVPNSLGPAKLLLHYGTEEQRDHYLPRLASGDEIPCFALTAPDAGSDAASMVDYGIVCRQRFRGSPDVLGIRLNWDKRYITLAPVATLLGLAFKLYDPEHLLGETEELGITLALIPVTTRGVTIGRRHLPLNIAFLNGPTSGKDVFIPLDWVIGGRQGVGQGWRMLMECLADGRALSLPALSTGAGKLASRATGAYARIRKQFKLPIGRFEGVEEALARIAMHTYVMDAARSVTAAAIDQGERPSVISAIAKYNLTERMRMAVNDAMDVQGGSAICMGPRNWLGRVYQALPISITVEGANILTRSLIIFGQGAIRCHPFALREIRAIQDPDRARGLLDFDRTLFAHLRLLLANCARALFLGLGGARRLATPVKGPERRHYRELTRMSAAFALVADAVMLLLGAELKRKEKLSGRLADVLSQLYLASATLKHFKDQGARREDLPLLDHACLDALYRIQESLCALLRNLPNRPAAAVLRFLVFPLGRPYRPPSDALGHRVAGLLLAPSAARDRLTAGIFIPQGQDEPLARLEDALPRVIAAEPIEKRLYAAAQRGQVAGNTVRQQLAHALRSGLVNRAEAALLQAAEEARQAVIKVDDFPFTQLLQEEAPWPKGPEQPVADQSM